LSLMTIYAELHDAVERDGSSDDVLSRVAGILDEVIDGRLEIRSVRHPLGFLCLPVHRHGDEGICIHVWTAGWRTGRLTTSSMHCHSWELLSHVLYGELSNQIIELVDTPDHPTHRVFEVHSTAAGDQIVATARVVRPRVAATAAYRAGDPYHLPAGVFHETVVAAAQHAATVALGRVRGGTIDLSLGGLRTPSHPVRREYCSREETVRAAVSVRHALAERRLRGSGQAGRR
jgi:hypothetical protein